MPNDDLAQAPLETEDWLVILIGVAICLAITVALFSVGFNPLVPRYHFNNLLVYASAWAFVLGGLVLVELLRHKPDSPIRYLRDEFFDARRKRSVRRALIYSFLLAVFGTLFSLGKRAIPLFNPYSWDHSIIAVDAAIHGQDAWRVLQPLLGYPLVTYGIAWIYQVWVLLIYIGNFYFIFFEKDSTARARFIFAYLLTWTIVGLVAASALASVGPCFLEPLLQDSYFHEQMAYLNSVHEAYHLNIIQIEQNLLKWYFNGDAILGAGISAMPSMHVAEATLVFLAMRHKPKWVGVLFGVFALMILIGSVHLGLHYAVDGYFAIFLTIAIWLFSRKLFSSAGKAPRKSAPEPA